MESILTLDRLRQNVAIKELEQTHGQPMSMRKTVSVPNFSQVGRSPVAVHYPHTVRSCNNRRQPMIHLLNARVFHAHIHTFALNSFCNAFVGAINLSFVTPLSLALH